MKKRILLPVVAALCASISLTALAAPTIIVDGKTVSTDTPPTIINGRTLVPMRAIFTMLGADVVWDDASKSVLATTKDKKIFITADDALAFIDDSPVSLDEPATIINNRMFVPVRFVSESLNYSVHWDEENQIITINSPEDDAIAANQTTTPATRPEIDIVVDGNNTIKLGNYKLKGSVAGKKINGKAAIYDSSDNIVYYGTFAGDVNKGLYYDGEGVLFGDDWYLKANFTNGNPEGKGTFYYVGGYYTVDFINGVIQDNTYSVYDYNDNYIGTINYTNGEMGIYSLTKSLFY